MTEITLTLGQSLIFAAMMAALAGLIGFAAGYIHGCNRTAANYNAWLHQHNAKMNEILEESGRRDQ